MKNTRIALILVNTFVLMFLSGVQSATGQDIIGKLQRFGSSIGSTDKMGHKDGEVIQHSMVTKSIERAQKKIEENNYGIRKRLLEYDDVMNIQREAIYSKRYNALSGERLSLDLYTMFTSLMEALVRDHKSDGTFETFKMASYEILGLDPEKENRRWLEIAWENCIPELIKTGW